MMDDARTGLLFLFLLTTPWAGHGRNLVTPPWRAIIYDISVTQLNNAEPENGMKVEGNKNVCEMCELYITQIVEYFKENKTQKEVMDTLHQTCSQVPYYSEECLALVDYYVPLFFLKMSLIQPKELCQKINLCKQAATISLAAGKEKNSCDMCHHTVEEVLVKLKDPDIQMEIIEFLLKGCDSVENYIKKCKKMVFEYGPLILTNAEQFLETNDLCTVIHACNSHVSSA